MISTSCMTGTGFMKCMPMTRSGRWVAAASVVIEIDDVLLARIAAGGVDCVQLRKSSSLSFERFGGRFDRDIDVEIFDRGLGHDSTRAHCSRRGLSRARSIARPFSIARRDRSGCRLMMHRRNLRDAGIHLAGIAIDSVGTALRPACAPPPARCPQPIWPAPTTADLQGAAMSWLLSDLHSGRRRLGRRR